VRGWQCCTGYEARPRMDP